MKKIVILNGSPRRNGNTSALVKKFMEGAEKKGHDVQEFFLDSMGINGCKGCFGGGKNPESPCVQKDGMEEIYPKYRDADVVVLASPLYSWQISGQLKCAFDRLFALMECGNTGLGKQKESVMLMAAQGNGFEETLLWYRNMEKHLGWKNAGEVMCPGVLDIGDIDGKEELQKAYDLGWSL